MDPKFDIENPPANMTEDRLFNTVVPHVMNKIKADQPTKEEWFAKIKSAADDIKTFIAKNKPPRRARRIARHRADARSWTARRRLAKLIASEPL